MAIYHLSMKTVSRASGRSAVGAAAYRSGQCLTNERDGLVHDYTRKGGVEHAEIVLPDNSRADWARDREALWNAAEFAEKRKDARVAREIEVALPHELSGDERLALVREVSHAIANRYGVAVDFAIHTPDLDMDVRNAHAHILFTTRSVHEDGLGDKTDLERENAWLKAHDLQTTDEQLKALRIEWEELANRSLARAGHDIRIDHRSHQDRGLELEPTQHVGVHATQMERQGKEVERERLAEETRARNAELIRQNPEQVLSIITGEKSVFDRRDVARTLHRYINDDACEYQALYTRVMASDELVRLAEDRDGIRYSTREMVELETGMARDVARMQDRTLHGVKQVQVERAIERQSAAIRRGVASDLGADLSLPEREERVRDIGLSQEQKEAVRHLTGREQISVVVGFAGAGKSTLLAAAREAWEEAGYHVHGATLAGKAVENLEQSAGIDGRTLASWDMRWQKGVDELGPRDILVIDEAGMVGSRQMARFVSEVERTGAKLVLVGDHEQLQAIGAGAPFRAIADEVGYASVEDIRRQKTDWQREASRAFATERTIDGLEAYAKHDAIHLVEDQELARDRLVRDYVEDVEMRPEGTRAAMAHRKVDVRDLNIDIREALKARGHLSQEEIAYQTDTGERAFAVGDRIVFLQNDRDLDVKNGTLGTVAAVEQGRLMVHVDGRDRDVAIDASQYGAFDHGYATTIHKTQGVTVDRSYVLASETMDRHMTYVAMTRHRDEVALYAGEDQFTDVQALKAGLGRSGAKETVLDYVDRDGRRRDSGQQLRGERATGERVRGLDDFARRRGLDSDIVYPKRRETPDLARAKSQERTTERTIDRKRDRTTERTLEPQPKVRGLFDGLKLKMPSPERDRDLDRDTKRERERDFVPSRSPLEKAVDRYARAYSAALEMRQKDLPILKGQNRALWEAEQSLEQARPGVLEIMHSALDHNPRVSNAMMELSGDERTRSLIKGLNEERLALADPHIRADRVVERWQSLSREQERLQNWRHNKERAPIETAMQEVAKEIARDPQLDSILRNRRLELGLARSAGFESLAHELERSIARDRDLGIGL